MSADELKRAAIEGRQAAPGSTNPYRGDRLRARAWLLGYTAMLRQTLEASPNYNKRSEEVNTDGK